MYNDWDKWYQLILEDFSFSKSEDIFSAKLLNEKINKIGKYDITHTDFGNNCIIFGAGPSIKTHIQYLKMKENIENYILIAADGATTALLEEGIIPDIIVTDLDGDINKIIESNKKGSILYVHAHGDNTEKIKKYISQLNNIIPTCQCEPFDLLENYGGFTDGDRAMHIAVYALDFKKIILAGMDFGKIVTKYSRPEIENETENADSFKTKKLEYAEKLYNSLKKENIQIDFINLKDSI